MSGLIACYGQQGPTAGGDPRVAELLNRSVDGLYESITSFDATLASIQSRGLVPWTAPVVELTLMNYQWLTRITWERATVFMDAFIAGGALDDVAYRQVDILCDQASQATLNVIGVQAEVAQGKQPGLRKLETLPSLPVTKENCHAVWASYDAIYRRVQADIALIIRLGVPARMSKVHQLLSDSFQPAALKFSYLLKQWSAANALENRMQIVRDAQPHVANFYAIGQQLWTPYLVGSIYTEIVRSITLFEKLGFSFDPWVLTDPEVAAARVTDMPSCHELAAFWKTVSDTSSAVQLQEQITQAVLAGIVTIRPGMTYKIAPWQPQYVAHGAVVIGQQTYSDGEAFAIYPRGNSGERVIETRSVGRA